MKVAIFGGSFDPPTMGHMYVVAQALECGFDEIWVVPSKRCWFKPYRVDFEVRRTLVEAAIDECFGSNVRVRVMPIEAEMPGAMVSTWDLWRFLRQRYPDCEFVFVFGADAWQSAPSWERGAELVRDLPHLVIPRQPDGGVSSSRARELIRTGCSAEGVVPLVVQSMIQQHGWYR